MARKQLGDYTELQDLAQASERTPQTTDRVPITRGGRNLNMCISTLMQYINAHITLEGETAETTIAAINGAIADLQEQIDALTQTDLDELLSQLQAIKDFLDEFGDDEDLSGVLQTLKSSILDEVSDGYAPKADLEELGQAVADNAAAIESMSTAGGGCLRMTRTEYNSLKNSEGVQDDVWYIVTDNTDTSIVREVRVGLTLIAKNEDLGNNGFTYVFPFTFTS